MYNRNDLTLTLFYASCTSDEGSKVAMFTVQVNNTDMVSVQSNTLQCISDKSGKKGQPIHRNTTDLQPGTLVDGRAWGIW